jgi:hypothetical protein
MAKAGWIMTALLLLFLLPASVAPKLMSASVAVEALAEIGWPARYLLMLGVVELGCLVLFVIPRTSLLGAVLTTALLGGAMASHLRAGSPLFSHTLFGVYLGLFMWIALWLRDARLRSMLPWERRDGRAGRRLDESERSSAEPTGL